MQQVSTVNIVWMKSTTPRPSIIVKKVESYKSLLKDHSSQFEVRLQYLHIRSRLLVNPLCV